MVAILTEKAIGASKSSCEEALVLFFEESFCAIGSKLSPLSVSSQPQFKTSFESGYQPLVGFFFGEDPNRPIAFVQLSSLSKIRSS